MHFQNQDIVKVAESLKIKCSSARAIVSLFKNGKRKTISSLYTPQNIDENKKLQKNRNKENHK